MVACVLVSGCSPGKAATEMLDVAREYVQAYYSGDFERALNLTSGDAHADLSRKLPVLRGVKWEVHELRLKMLRTNRDGTRGSVVCAVTWEEQATPSKCIGQHVCVLDLMKFEDGWKVYSVQVHNGPGDLD
ncbi:MAG: hypothetical protein ACPLPR_01435 [Bacillota bacterium]